MKSFIDFVVTIVELYLIAGIVLVAFVYVSGMNDPVNAVMLDAFKVKCFVTGQNYELEMVKILINEVVTWPSWMGIV